MIYSEAPATTHRKDPQCFQQAPRQVHWRQLKTNSNPRLSPPWALPSHIDLANPTNADTQVLQLFFKLQTSHLWVAEVNALVITHVQHAAIESLKNRLLPDKIRLFQVLKKNKNLKNKNSPEPD